MRRIVIPFAMIAPPLAACVGGPTAPAPVEFRGRAETAGAALPSADASTSAQTPRPHPVDLSPTWADGPGTPLSAWAITPNEAQPFDPRALPASIVVAPGDTLFSVSQRYQVPLRSLIDANRLPAPFILKEGADLALPPPRLHTVERGETLLSLSRRFAIDARSLALLNRLAKPYAVRAGETIVLPALARPPAASLPPPSTPTKTATARPGAVTQASGAKPAGAPALVWPVTGEIAVRFGPQQGGRRSDGLDIAAAPGAPIRAAADGRVVYAGEDLPGYGKLMLVQHDGDWVTAYAHCARIAVAEGARVKRGETIAEAGPAPVHFQLRRGAQPTDPLPALPKA